MICNLTVRILTGVVTWERLDWNLRFRYGIVACHYLYLYALKAERCGRRRDEIRRQPRGL